MSETPQRPDPANDPASDPADGPAKGPDATDTAVQPAAAQSEQPPQPAQQPAGAPGAAPADAEAALNKNRFAWVSSPKVAAATVITVLALGSLGGAFALGRATAPDHDDRMLVRVPAGFEGRGGFEGPPGLEFHERGPGFRQRFYEGEIEQAPPAPGQEEVPEVTPSPSQSS